MGLIKDYFFRRIKTMDFVESGTGYDINVNWSGHIGRNLDTAQDALDAQVWIDVQRYMPRDTGALIGETNAVNMSTRGEVYLYPDNSAYGHYQYEGIVYVDPVTRAGGFLTRDGWRSRRGVQKVPTERRLIYKNPTATARWGETAITNHKEQWKDLVNRILTS